MNLYFVMVLMDNTLSEIFLETVYHYYTSDHAEAMRCFFISLHVSQNNNDPRETECLDHIVHGEKAVA